MKKLLTIATVLLTAALVFTGCSNPAASSGGGDGGPSLPGNWTTTAETYTSYKKNDGRTITVNEKTVTCTIVSTELSDSDKPDGGITYWTYPITTDTKEYTGFKASAKCSSSNCGYGLVFCGVDIDSSHYSAYTLLISNDGFKVRKTISNATSDITDWQTNACIKAEPTANDVIVYTDSNSIIIQINGTQVYKIDNPELKKGWVGFTTNIAKKDVDAASTVTQTYTFNEFQY